MKPTIIANFDPDYCIFRQGFEDEAAVPVESLPVIPSLPYTKVEREDNDGYYGTGSAAIKVSGGWTVQEVTWSFRRRLGLRVQCDNNESEELAYPIDPRILPVDIVDANEIGLNEKGDAWVFHHAHINQHHDHEQHLRSAVTSAFEDQFHAFRVALDNQIQAAIASDSGRAALGTMRHAYNAFGQFRTAVRDEILREARDGHIGHRAQNPTDSHIHGPLIEALDATIELWKTQNVAKYASIKAYVDAVRSAAGFRHAYEPRWIKHQKAPGRGVDPVDGYEYCYTRSSGTKPVLVGDLPDPNWNFDQLRTGAVDRGSFRYYDGLPELNQFLVIAWRFRRPIPKGTEPGADIGHVAWELHPTTPLSAATES